MQWSRDQIQWKPIAWLLTVLFLSNSAQAGQHENGVLVPHVAPSIEYSYGTEYALLSDLRNCEDAIPSGPTSPDQALVWFLIAGLEKCPGPIELAGAQFGFRDFDCSRISFAEWGPSHTELGCLEIPGENWPGPNSGTAITINPQLTESIVEIYWFATYVYGEVSIELGPDPFYGDPAGQFATNGNTSGQSIADEIVEFGIVGFGTDGWNPCVSVPLDGACCIGESCEDGLTRSECRDEGGTYQGDNTDCFPRNPCEENSLPTTWGKLKRIYRY